MLKRVAEQDQEITKTVITPLICHELMRVYELFHKDGMLQDDIFQLIKVLATIPGNAYFDQHFMPQVYQSLQNFGVALKQGNATEMSKYLDSGLLRSFMNIVGT